ncbi:MAG TPA: PP2C family protein-serine/threonine phosphatase [Tepidisphaeraceae bacterium]|nr:PP2C family protein-serine/threonine phosphatase [Tepidisphaeraceae bacterium]
MLKRRPWSEELAIIDQTMRAISSISNPEELVNAYWNGVGQLIAVDDYVSLSRRDCQPPYYRITRSSRFTEHPNPWTQREKLPHLSGGILGEIIYANKPAIIDDLSKRLADDDPAHFYLQGFETLVALPQYDGGEGLNVTVMLLPAGMELDHTMIPMMHWQAGLFGRGTTNLVLRNQLTAALASLDRELQTVGAIQRSLLPKELPRIDGFELAAHYETSARAGGDYYDFFPLAGGRWGMFIADVSGHGTPAAVLMAITHAIAHSQPGTHAPPEILLEYLNKQLTRAYTREGTFVTAFYAVLDPATRSMSYSVAGHNPPRLLRGKQIISLSENGALPLGILEEETYGLSTIALQKNDLLLLYTDGVTEAAATVKKDERRQLFGVGRLDKVLQDCFGYNSKTCIDRIRTAVASFTGNAPTIDDQTLIAIRCQ